MTECRALSEPRSLALASKKDRPMIIGRQRNRCWGDTVEQLSYLSLLYAFIAAQASDQAANYLLLQRFVHILRQWRTKLQQFPGAVMLQLQAVAMQCLAPDQLLPAPILTVPQ